MYDKNSPIWGVTVNWGGTPWYWSHEDQFWYGDPFHWTRDKSRATILRKEDAEKIARETIGAYLVRLCG